MLYIKNNKKKRTNIIVIFYQFTKCTSSTRRKMEIKSMFPSKKLIVHANNRGAVVGWKMHADFPEALHHLRRIRNQWYLQLHNKIKQLYCAPTLVNCGASSEEEAAHPDARVCSESAPWTGWCSLTAYKWHEGVSCSLACTSPSFIPPSLVCVVHLSMIRQYLWAKMVNPAVKAKQNWFRFLLCTLGKLIIKCYIF